MKRLKPGNQGISLNPNEHVCICKVTASQRQFSLILGTSGTINWNNKIFTTYFFFTRLKVYVSKSTRSETPNMFDITLSMFLTLQGKKVR